MNPITSEDASRRIETKSSSDALKTLKLFNEKADEFLSARFFGDVGGGGAIVEFRRDSGWDGVYVGPDEEATKALVLTLRLFMQKKEPVSIQSLAELYRSLPLSTGIVEEFEAARSELNAFLDSDSHLAIEEDRCLTQREILKIFLYGEYAHVGPDHRQTYEDLRTTPFFPLFQNSLVKILVVFATCVSALRATNLRATAEITADGP